MTAGTATYYGSTPPGEMRELCDTRDFYADWEAGAVRSLERCTGSLRQKL